METGVIVALWVFAAFVAIAVIAAVVTVVTVSSNEKHVDDN